MILLSIVLTLFCLVGWIMGAMRPHHRAWISIGGGPAVVFLGLYFYVVCQRTEPSLDFQPVGVHWSVLFFMIGGVWALLSKPKAPAARNDDKGGGIAA